MFKRCKVVPLSTNQKSSISFVFNTAYKKILSFKDSFSDNITFGEYVYLYILSNDKIKESDWCYVKWGVDINGKDLFKVAQCTKIGALGIHYFDEISMCWGSHELNAMKIIATTDTSLIIGVPQFIKGYLPQPSQSFIEKYVTEYNKGNVITDVLVEYENNYDLCYYTPAGGIECCDKIDNWQLKVSKDNTITIKKVKDSWSREEVVTLCLKMQHEYPKFVQESCYIPNMREIAEWTNNWISENL